CLREPQRHHALEGGVFGILRFLLDGAVDLFEVAAERLLLNGVCVLLLLLEAPIHPCGQVAAPRSCPDTPPSCGWQAAQTPLPPRKSTNTRIGSRTSTPTVILAVLMSRRFGSKNSFTRTA